MKRYECVAEEKCTGNYVDPDASNVGNGLPRPPSGTKCVGGCINESGRWGASYCFTEVDESNWGAECISCPGLNCPRNLEECLNYTHLYFIILMSILPVLIKIF